MRKTAISFLALLRPHQWLKNLLLLFPPFFGGKILEADVLTVIVPSFLSFSFVASSGYILNDIMDRNHDQYHRSKKDRPIARGDVPVVLAVIVATCLCLAAVFVASTISRKFEGFLILYLFNSLLYSLYLKNVVIIDIIIVSLGFLLRILAGGEAFHVAISNWLFLTVFVVSLFLAVAKRLGEKTILGPDDSLPRQVLAGYSLRFLAGLMWTTALSAIVIYTLYSIENDRNLIYTVPLAVLGFFRYIHITKQEGKGDPTEAFFEDPQIAITGIAWFITVAFLVYR